MTRAWFPAPRELDRIGGPVPADTPVHRLAPQCKVAATVLFVLAVACTPAGAYRPYLCDLLLLTAVATLARLPPLTLARRLLVEVPFVLFVLVLPVLDGPPRVTVLGNALSVPGLHAAATITLKATFGLLAVIWGSVRFRAAAVPYAVAAYITAAYWFTASTSFANPAVTIARSLSDTFAGIRPVDVAPFIAAQLAGGFSAAFIFEWLTPQSSDARIEP